MVHEQRAEKSMKIVPWCGEESAEEAAHVAKLDQSLQRPAQPSEVVHDLHPKFAQPLAARGALAWRDLNRTLWTQVTASLEGLLHLEAGLERCTCPRYYAEVRTYAKGGPVRRVERLASLEEAKKTAEFEALDLLAKTLISFLTVEGCAALFEQPARPATKGEEKRP